MEVALAVPAAGDLKCVNLFERYLTVWVALCIVVGVLVGQAAPGLVASLRTSEFGEGSHINVPIAILMWLMMIPMMMKVDFLAVRRVGERPMSLVVTLFVNWLVKPFSIVLLA